MHYISPVTLVRRSRIGVRVLLPASAVVLVAQALRLPITQERQYLTMMVFLCLLAGVMVSAFGYIAGRCMLCAADAFGAGYRHAGRREASEPGPARLTVVE